MELDLSKPRDAYIKVEDTWYRLQYEGLHLACFGCGCYGHAQAHCPLNAALQQTPDDSLAAPREVRDDDCQSSAATNMLASSSTIPAESHISPPAPPPSTLLNTWNLVQTRRGRRTQRNGEAGKPSTLGNSANRFDALPDKRILICALPALLQRLCYSVHRRLLAIP